MIYLRLHWVQNWGWSLRVHVFLSIGSNSGWNRLDVTLEVHVT